MCSFTMTPPCPLTTLSNLLEDTARKTIRFSTLDHLRFATSEPERHSRNARATRKSLGSPKVSAISLRLPLRRARTSAISSVRRNCPRSRACPRCSRSLRGHCNASAGCAYAWTAPGTACNWIAPPCRTRVSCAVEGKFCFGTAGCRCRMGSTSDWRRPVTGTKLLKANVTWLDYRCRGGIVVGRRFGKTENAIVEILHANFSPTISVYPCFDAR